MRNDQEFLAEIYSREAKYIKRKKKIIKATLLSVIPLFICTAVILGVALGPTRMFLIKSAPTADRETLYTGNYEEITDTADDAEGEVAEDTTTESETDNGADDVASQEEALGGNLLSSANSENQFSDSNFSAASTPSANEELKEDTVSSKAGEGSVVSDSSSESSGVTTNKSENESGAPNKNQTSDSGKTEETPSKNEFSQLTVNGGYIKELTANCAGITLNGKKVDEKFANANTQFYLNLLKNLNNKNENVLISPLSIVNALGMTANGAKDKTLTEMEQVIAGGMNIDEFNRYIKNYSGLNRSKAIHLANSIWIRNDRSIIAKDAFLNKCKGVYKAQVFKSDFDSFGVQQINDWVNKNTRGKISRMVDNFKKSDKMLLVNATYFADTWIETFDPKYDIRVKKFTNADGKKVKVNMMFNREDLYLSGENCTGFLKKYEHGYSFAALLPDEGMTTEEFLQDITSEELQEVLNNPEAVAVDIALPKFKVDYSADLPSVLRKMGMETPFSADLADFGKMAKSDRNLYIGNVVHKTTIDLNENGTVAAAITGVVMGAAGLPSEIKEVKLNRPFVYFIIDDTTKLPIFCGTINNLPAVK